MANEVYKNDPNLQGLWLVNEVSGNRSDYTSNNNTLTDNNSVGSSTDHREGTRSADFESGNNEYLSITDALQTGLDITGNITVLFWHKPETIVGSDQYIAKYQITGNNRCWKVREGGTDGVAVLISSDGTATVTAQTPDSQISVGDWVHIAFVYNSTDIRIYINGILASNGASNPLVYAGGIADKPSNFQIGVQHGGSNYIDGLMDEIAVFDRALSALEIASVYSNGIQSPVSSIAPTTPSFHQSTSLSINIWKPTIGSYTPRGTLVDDSIAFKLNSYSHTLKAIGGYWSASFTINDRLDKIENWMDRLGHHVEVYSPSLVKIWEGFIANVFPNVGGLSVQRGPLTNIANRLATVYSTVDTSISPPAIGMREKTTPINDTDSQGIYGIIEKILSIGGATDATATQVGDTWLAENALPETSQSFNSNSSATNPGITVECLGYVWFLNFYVYNQVTNTGTRDISDIIQDILTADPNTLFSTDYSGIDANTLEVKRYVNDDNTAWHYIKSLVGKGDASDNRHTFGIYNDRKAQYGAIPTDVAYLQRLADPKQRVETPSGLEIKPWEVLPNKWLFLPDFLIGKSQPSNFREDSRYIFLEQITFTAPWGLSYSGGKVANLDQKLARMGLGSAG